MRKKFLTGLLLAAMTTALFTNAVCVSVKAAEYENNNLCTQESSSTEECIASGQEETWMWSIDQTGKLNINGELTARYNEYGHFVDWPWREYSDQIISVKITGFGVGSIENIFYGLSQVGEIDMSDFDTILKKFESDSF